MRWEFVRFARPILLGCDQPVVCWLNPYVSSPWAPMVEAEVRLPLGQRWRLSPSGTTGRTSVQLGPRYLQQALSLNHHTRGQRGDWVFWQPGSTPPIGSPAYDYYVGEPAPLRSLARPGATWDQIRELMEPRAHTVLLLDHPGQADSPVVR